MPSYSSSKRKGRELSGCGGKTGNKNYLPNWYFYSDNTFPNAFF